MLNVSNMKVLLIGIPKLNITDVHLQMRSVSDDPCQKYMYSLKTFNNPHIVVLTVMGPVKQIKLKYLNMDQ